MIVSVTYQPGPHIQCQLFKTVDQAYSFLFGFKEDLREVNSYMSPRTKKVFRAMLEATMPLTFDSINPELGSTVTVRKHQL